MYGHALRRVGYGPQAGRILGTVRVKDALYALLANRDLKGGTIWVEEQTYGRLRHIQRRYNTPVLDCTLHEAAKQLLSAADTYVSGSSFYAGQEFLIKNLLSDIEILQSQGVVRLGARWENLRSLDLHSQNGQETFSSLIDLYHRKRQIAYKEIVESSFPMLAKYLRTFRMMPMRLEIEATFYHARGFEDISLNHRRWPVETFEQAGADVIFVNEKSDFYSQAAVAAYVKRTDDLLKRFSRFYADRVVTWGGTSLPDFEGHDTSFGDQPDESPVIRGAIDWLKEDLDDLFAEFPGYPSFSN